jgi:hypothetical protein
MTRAGCVKEEKRIFIRSFGPALSGAFLCPKVIVADELNSKNSKKNNNI